MAKKKPSRIQFGQGDWKRAAENQGLERLPIPERIERLKLVPCTGPDDQAFFEDIKGHGTRIETGFDVLTDQVHAAQLAKAEQGIVESPPCVVCELGQPPLICDVGHQPTRKFLVRYQGAVCISVTSVLDRVAGVEVF